MFHYLTRIAAALAVACLMAAPASAQGIFGAGAYPDACQMPTVVKQSVAINITTATTTQLVALVAAQSVYVCGFAFDVLPSATAADTATIEYGTGAACGTGTTALTGAFGAGYTTATAPVLYAAAGQAMTVLKTPPGQALCLLSAGTTVNIQGYLTYVQQ
jgi:hypothetical protein